MEFTFERGDLAQPKGHALIYFRSSQDPTEVLGSYLVVPPIPLNLSRYMPPMFASQLPAADVQNRSAIPLPPLPEKVESHVFLQSLAEARGDDLIFGGTLNPADMQQGLLLVSEAAQRYQQLYADYLQRLPPPPAEPEATTGGMSDVFYSLMSEKQLLAELTKLTGKLRYAVGGGDARLTRETVEEMGALGRHVPEKYRVADLIAAAQIPGARGERLSQLYIDRCYRLSEEDYVSLRAIDEEMQKLQAED